MKKIFNVFMSLVLLFSFTSCNVNNPETSTTNNSTTENNTNFSDNKSQTTEDDTVVPGAEPMKTVNGKNLVEYGKKTGTEKTHTGLEPLPEIELIAVDGENFRKLSEEKQSHSYGVSKNGEPHEISVNFQKKYEQFNAYCLDTSGEKTVYLTFDCGYENGETSKILDVLKEKDVSAAFFVTLPYLKTAPEVAARMINEGHVIGNHSDTHANFSLISRTEMAKEIQSVENYLRNNFGYSSKFFRFPEGVYTESALDLVNNLNYVSVFWSSSYADWDVNNLKGKDYAFKKVTERLHPGCVLLLHAVSKDNREALGDIIDFARANGYEFKSLTQK